MKTLSFFFFFLPRKDYHFFLFLIGYYFSTEKRVGYLSFFWDKEWRWFLEGKILALESSSMRVACVFPEIIWRKTIFHSGRFDHGNAWGTLKRLQQFHWSPPTLSRCDSMKKHFLVDWDTNGSKISQYYRKLTSCNGKQRNNYFFALNFGFMYYRPRN